ncbi:MAG: hypothetical protein PHS14_00355 [Elusimicrobia bacterium]|nr:hypothetical protein [Elusimicrobiota bacterium]
MASPQLENGHSRLANEILEALIKCPPATVTARQLWDWIWRHSWGWKGAANTRPTSVRALAEALGLSNGAAGRALESLLGTRHAVRNEDGSLTIQKDHEQWIYEKPLGRKPPVSKQLFLLGNDPAECPTGGDKVSPRAGQKCPTGGDKTVPTRGTLTIRSVKKGKKHKGAAPGAVIKISNLNNDTPRTRAEAGDPERPPEEHPHFGKLPFKRREELTDAWKANSAKRLCKNGCGRAKASDTWPYCKPCTRCTRCRALVDGVRKFVLHHSEIVCSDCRKERS